MDVKSAIEEAGLVPDCIDIAPSLLIQMKYGEKAVELGTKLTPTEVQKAPDSISWDADSNTFYTLVMLDPDAISRRLSFFRSVKHWLVGNIPGNDIASGEIFADYAGSGPPPGTGFHRYAFFVYAQNTKLEFKERLNDSSRISRMNFSMKTFSKKYDLGEPIAGNFFLAAYDSSGPSLWQRLRGQTQNNQ